MKENMDDFAKSLESELMNYSTDYEDEKIHENSEAVEAEHSDATECSTSFDDSDCGGVDASGEAEVLSDFGAAAASGNLLVKRRKLSPHWRAFIHPLMWRCKWVELQMSKLGAEARAYERKLQGSAASEGVVWRKRRRRAEATNDVAAYMSSHNLFSYYENRIAHKVLKTHPAVGTREDLDELGNDEGGEHDKALEEILRKLEALQWRVRKLKSRVVEYEKEEEEEEEEEDKLAWVQSGAHPSPTTTRRRMPVTTNYIASQLLAEYNLGGVLLPGATHHHPAPQNELVEDEEEDEDDVLIDNHRVREELRYFKRVKKAHSAQPRGRRK
ncbi:uncharacterized protein LOC131020601 isoform X2 [Salvia miltiorrhiza]|uniref:uncharacterized protein LOC131020601 isoform X2 n=1 Tax=Salvia miltiorrhiza TaxID=226208 RepID=UPI0025AC3B89|nr:uncharacterized protein LOC131020601 isoform X2 [Salvia miltiorrhiza]